MGKTVKKYVHVYPTEVNEQGITVPTGPAVLLSPGDEVPEWATITNPAIFEEDEESTEPVPSTGFSAQASAEPEDSGKSLGNMTHAELDDHAAKHGIDLGDASTRNGKIAVIQGAAG